MLREAQLIAGALRDLRERAPDAEIIVVDGGSDDATPERARPLCDLLISSAPGRGRQMNAGAAVARGDVFWFLHADCRVPENCLREITQALADPRVAGGYFRIRLPADRFVYRLSDSFAHHAGKLLCIRCADHGFFCRREVFERIGGFPDLPLMEDVEFYRAMCQHGRVVAIDARLTVSARRYEKVGATKLTLAYGLIASLYAVGVPPAGLHKLYRATCSTK